MPYKRPQIAHVLESLIANSKFREVDGTTKRLVERCLGGEWRVQLRRDSLQDGDRRSESSGPDNISVTSAPSGSHAFLAPAPVTGGGKQKTLKSSRSFENLKSKPHKARTIADVHRQGSTDSAASLPHVASAVMPSPTLAAPAARRRDKAGAINAAVPVLERHAHILEETGEYIQEPQDMPEISSLSLSPEIRVLPSASASSVDLTDISHMPPRARTASPRRPPPPPPVKRRKPPAVPSDAATRTRKLMSPSPPALSPLGMGFRK